MRYEFKNGRMSEAWTIPEDQYICDAYWDPTSSIETIDIAQQAVAMVEPTFPDVPGATSSETKALIDTFYNRIWDGDMAGMQQTVADDIVFYVPGHSHLAGEYRTWNDYLAFRDKLLELAGDEYKLEIASIAASETDVFVKEYVRMKRKWDPAVQTIFVILHF